MIQIEFTDVYGWEAAIRGMRNPFNSWDKSDSNCSTIIKTDDIYLEGFIGKNDLSLMEKLIKAGPDHSKFMRYIIVTCDITAPLYWWKEYDTYKVGTVANSCSTMHTIHAKEFTLEDFSCDHLIGMEKRILKETINVLNAERTNFLLDGNKQWWWQMIQLLPTSYNQRRTVLLNYAVLRNMYHARKNHKLDEWHTFCRWVETLPYSELITL